MGRANPETVKRWKRAHPEQARTHQRDHYEKKRQLGLCVNCGQAAGGAIRCSSCVAKWRKYRNEWQRKRREERREAGLCIDCGAEANVPPYCDDHRAAIVRQRAARERLHG